MHAVDCIINAIVACALQLDSLVERASPLELALELFQRHPCGARTGTCTIDSPGIT